MGFLSILRKIGNAAAIASPFAALVPGAQGIAGILTLATQITEDAVELGTPGAEKEQAAINLSATVLGHVEGKLGRDLLSAEAVATCAREFVRATVAAGNARRALDAVVSDYQAKRDAAAAAAATTS